MRRDSSQTVVFKRQVFPWILRRCWLAVFVLAAGVSTVSSTYAGFVQGSYQIDIAESERLLNAMLQEQRGEISQDNLSEIQHQEMCRTPLRRMIDRNRPAILLQNTSNSSSNNELSQFTIDLQQLGYEFGSGDFSTDDFDGLTWLSTKSDAGISITSSYGTVSDSDPTIDPSKIVLDITGLTPGKAAIFRIDIDPAPMVDFLYPDYRMVVMGEDAGGGPGSPALVSATFAAGGMTSSTALSEFGGEGSIPQLAVLEGYNTQSNVEMHTNVGETTIPEPSTGLLFLLGFGFTTRRRWSR